MAGAPVANREEMCNFSDANVITASYLGLGPSPWKGDAAKEYQERSPIPYATRIKAPTLIMSNMEDFRVPPIQAFALYHASADPVHARERTRLWMDRVKQHIGN